MLCYINAMNVAFFLTEEIQLNFFTILSKPEFTEASLRAFSFTQIDLCSTNNFFF